MDSLAILAFDTSTPRCIIAVGRMDPATGTAELLAHDDDDDAPNQASSRLSGRIGRCLASAGLEVARLGAIACGRGPGTFTGTRVAVATAKGMALGLQVPVVPVSTLAVVAASTERTGAVLAVIDARRGEAYGGLFRCGPVTPGRIAVVESAGPEHCAPLPELVQQLSSTTGPTVAGPGLRTHGDALPADLGIHRGPPTEPNAHGLWRATCAAVAAGRFCDPAAVQAVYLRKTYAELGLNRPKRPVHRNPVLSEPST